MKMKITGLTDGTHRILILDTDGKSLTPKELALFFTRSITILGDVFLAGPDPAGEYLAFNETGRQIPLGAVHRDVLKKPKIYHPMELPTLNALLALGEREMEG